MSRLLEWLTARYMFRCDHRDEAGDSTWVPYFYGRVIATDVVATLSICTSCGAVLAETP